jgi:hypothetical protein
MNEQNSSLDMAIEHILSGIPVPQELFLGWLEELKARRKAQQESQPDWLWSVDKFLVNSTQEYPR